MTQMERSEGEPVSMDVSARSFEDADGKRMHFQVDTKGAQQAPPVVGTATRAADDDMRVELTKPAPKAIDFGHDVLFPTQHIERLIEAAKNGGGAIQARVYDGSDTGAKVYATLAVVGKEASKPGDDADAAAELKGVRHWPVVVSYFDEKSKDSAPEYILSFDLYENGVSGSPEARLRDLRAASAPSEARNPPDASLREITALKTRPLTASAALHSIRKDSRLSTGYEVRLQFGCRTFEPLQHANDLFGTKTCLGRELNQKRLVRDEIPEDAAAKPRGGRRSPQVVGPQPGHGKKLFESLVVGRQERQGRDRHRFAGGLICG